MAAQLRTVFIVNPHSANGATQRRWPQLAEAIQAEWGVRPEARFTQTPGEATTLTREALRQGYARIVSVGGDGTNNEVIGGFFEEDTIPEGAEPPPPRFVNSDAIFAFVPSGTGGDLRRTFPTPDIGDPAAVARHLQGDQARRIDLGRISLVPNEGGPLVMRPFLNIASLGLGGETCHKVNASSKALGGKASFMLGSLRALVAHKARWVRLRVRGPEGETHKDVETSITAICNGRAFGGGMFIAPEARPDDGLFDIVVVGPLRGARFLSLTRTYSGTHLNLPWVSMVRGNRVDIEPMDDSGGPVWLEVDGETPGKLPCTIEIFPGALRIHAPAS